MDKDRNLYIAWKNIKERCYNPNSSNFKYYGGRGVFVCDKWKANFKEFQRWSFENGYTKGLSIDRIDNEKGYSPDNCRWVSKKEQANNKRNNHFLTYKGKTQTIAQWSEETGISSQLISKRINKFGWDVERTLTELPFVGKNQSYKSTETPNQIADMKSRWGV